MTSLTREQIVNLTMRLVELDEMADIVIIDTGAGIADAVLEFVSASTEVLLVATPEPTSITDAYALLKTLYRKSEFSAENTRIKVIANRVTAQNEGRELFEKINLVVKKFLNISGISRRTSRYRRQSYGRNQLFCPRRTQGLERRLGNLPRNWRGLVCRHLTSARVSHSFLAI